MSAKQWTAGICLLVASAANTWADDDNARLVELLKPCAYSEPPTLVDAMSASKAEVEDMGVSVRGYIKAMQDSLACIDDVEKNNASKLTASDRETINVFYNNGVDQLTFFADEYNKQVKLYEKRQRMPDYQDIGAPERDPAADLWRNQQR